ncbi:MAG: AraC family ligand binding domain-containing protein [Acidimicrobiales bacterium]
MAEPDSEVVTITCTELDDTIDRYRSQGFQLDALGPADDPTWAELSNGRSLILLQAGTGPALDRRGLHIPEATPELSVEHESGDGWVTGRAGMRYRDLVPGRYGGAYIASHIHIPDGGPVADYVHHHDIAYQLIFCHRGWVRVVYQDQGPSFVMNPGDCVLQPPGIRHQVLEASDDLFVVEVSCPAEHRTNVDHELTLPTAAIDVERRFGGQRFVRHEGATMGWEQSGYAMFDEQRTAIADATDGLAAVRLLRSHGHLATEPLATEPLATEPLATEPLATEPLPLDHEHDFLLLFVLRGSLGLQCPDGSTISLAEGSSVAVPPSPSATTGAGYALAEIAPDTELLEVSSSVAPS